MKFNEAWLREWVNPQIDRDALLEQLTMAGLEVDGVEAVAGDFSGVVVARVTACDKHPNADKLSVCEVDDGESVHQVVCGAPNVRAGLTVAFARVGAVLPGNFKIRKAKLRDVESRGMLCSAAELEIGDDHDGILELPDDLELGQDLRDALQLDDVIVDLDLTPNRGDCLSLRGLAREVAVLNRVQVIEPQPHEVPVSHDQIFEIELAAPEGCPRYLGRIIRSVDTSRPSPDWLVERLRRAGLRTIDPVVDVTNFVMLELGQPMHAFDLNELSGKIVVRMAQAGEKLTLLDGQEVELDAETLLITDATGPVAIAGVMGGERSGVQPDTRDVFLECAFFQPLAIAGTARRYGLQTDAAHRYERGVDFELQHLAMERASALLLEIVGGEAGPVVEAYEPSALPERAEVSLREARLNELLGIVIEPADVDAALEQLGFELLNRDDGPSGVVWTIRAPSHRFDIAREADLVEEICRIYGYNNIPSRQPATRLGLAEVPIAQSPLSELKQQLIDLGYQEAITYSFVDPKLQDLLAPGQATLTLANPMSVDLSVMRVNLLPGLIDALSANVSRQQDRVQLFEHGLIFVPGEELVQEERVGLLRWGRRAQESWNQPDAKVDFFDLKGDVERLLSWSGLREVTFEPINGPLLHPGQSARIVASGATIGLLGRLHPEIEARLDTVEGIFVAEFAASALLSRTSRTYNKLSKFPSVRRDLSLLVPAETPAQQLESLVRQALGDILIEFTLFDLYQGKGIDSTEKSVGLGLTLQHPSATLTDEEIGHYVDNALSALTAAVGARLR
jgi:phenylalanyl-tRNA synthetase beta chain